MRSIISMTCAALALVAANATCALATPEYLQRYHSARIPGNMPAPQTQTLQTQKRSLGLQGVVPPAQQSGQQSPKQSPKPQSTPVVHPAQRR